MSRSFRNTYREYSAKPVRGFHAGKIREDSKKRRYEIKKMVDEDGVPILPRHIGRTWPVYGVHIWWNEESRASFHFHRAGRMFIRLNDESVYDLNGKNLSRLEDLNRNRRQENEAPSLFTSAFTRKMTCSHFL